MTRVTLVAVRYTESWDHLDRLARSFTASCALAAYDPEVIIWDNGDGQGAGRTPAGATVLSSATNVFHSGGVNGAMEVATGDVVLCANPDMILGRACVQHLVESVQRADVTIAEGRQIPFDHPKEFDPETGRTSWASGALFAILADDFRRLGGFDEQSLPMYYNDVDLSWRARAAGGAVVYRCDAFAWHDKRPDDVGIVRESEYQNQHAPLGLMLLAAKWRRPDIVRRVRHLLLADRDGRRRSLVAQFDAAAAHGPAPQVDETDAWAADFDGLSLGGSRY